MPPVITSMVPATQRIGSNTDVVITGTGFAAPLRVIVDADNEVDALQVNVISATRVEATIPGVFNRGYYNVKVILQDASEDTLEDALAVIPATPANPFAKETFETIMNRMLQRLPITYDKREGSTFWDIFAPSAVEIENVYANMAELFELSFIPSSNGVYLDLKGLEHGVARKEAVKATGTVTITGTSAVVVPVGTKVGTYGSLTTSAIIFTTDIQITLVDQGGGVFNANVAVTAEIGGTDGNVAANSIKNIVTSISGLTTVNNAAATSGGIDLESDADYQARIIRHVREPSHGGNVADYIKWAQEIDRVGKVSVQPLWNGNGTVKVFILDNDGNLPTQDLIDDVQEHIDPTAAEGRGTAPVGATVTIAAPALVNMTIVTTVVLKAGVTASEVKDAVKENIENYIKDTLEIGEDVRYFAISKIIMDTAGVDTISALTVNGGTVDVTIGENQKATPLTVTVN